MFTTRFRRTRKHSLHWREAFCVLLYFASGFGCCVPFHRLACTVLLRSVRTTEYNAVYMIFYGQLYGACTLHTVPRRKRVYIITCNSMQNPAGIILPKNVPCRCMRSDHAVRKPACCDKRVVYQWLIDRGSNRGTIGQTLYTSFIHQRTGSKVKKKGTQETNSNELD